MSRLPVGPPLLALALAAAAPGLELEEARHLLARTGFGASLAEIQELAPLTRAAAVRRILDGVRSEPRLPPPGGADQAPPAPGMMQALPGILKMSFRQELREEGQLLKAWWYQEMRTTDSPFTERLTLFWHGHFTSSLQKAKWPPLMQRQNQLLRRHALGNFRTMLHGVARDPAMVIYLDNARNLARKPNENFAREVMELFTLGEGNYTEADIKAAARAFTGWSVDRASGTFWYRRGQHDYGPKTVLGRTGELSGDDVLDVLLAQPACAEHLTRKLWRELIGGEAPEGEVRRLAAVLRGGDYALRPWVEATLLSDAFWAREHRATRIRSPVHLLVGTARLLEMPLEDPLVLVQAGKQLGQDVLEPPNVKGWPGGERWITSSTLLQRDQLLRRALRGMQGAPGPARLAALDPQTLRKLVLATDPVNPVPAGHRGWRLVQDLILDPAYQLE